MDFAEFEALCRARRSLREYSSRPVPREMIDRCCDAARMAPSACNGQPWHFVIVDRDPLRAKIAQTAFAGIYRMCAFAAQAPVLVALVMGLGTLTAQVGGAAQGVELNLVDIGIAGEHFALAAAAQGLGTCWIGWFDAKKIAKLLGVGLGKKIPILFSLGFPPEGHSYPSSMRKPLEKIRDYAE